MNSSKCNFFFPIIILVKQTTSNRHNKYNSYVEFNISKTSWNVCFIIKNSFLWPLLHLQLYKSSKMNDIFHLLCAISWAKETIYNPYPQTDKMTLHLVNLQSDQKNPHAMHNSTTQTSSTLEILSHSQKILMHTHS
jgi:hypothetical protein